MEALRALQSLMMAFAPPTLKRICAVHAKVFSFGKGLDFHIGHYLS